MDSDAVKETQTSHNNGERVILLHLHPFPSSAPCSVGQYQRGGRIFLIIFDEFIGMTTTCW